MFTAYCGRLHADNVPNGKKYPEYKKNTWNKLSDFQGIYLSTSIKKLGCKESGLSAVGVELRAK